MSTLSNVSCVAWPITPEHQACESDPEPTEKHRRGEQRREYDGDDDGSDADLVVRLAENQAGDDCSGRRESQEDRHPVFGDGPGTGHVI
jgi:hypothetical protein